MSVLPMIDFAENRPADGPLLGDGRSVGFVFQLEQNRSGHWVLFQLTCVRSGPWGRTVRHLMKILGQKLCGFWCGARVERRTVRPWGADGPPVTSRFSQRRCFTECSGCLNRGRSAPRERIVREKL